MWYGQSYVIALLKSYVIALLNIMQGFARMEMGKAGRMLLIGRALRKIENDEKGKHIGLPVRSHQIIRSWNFASEHSIMEFGRMIRNKENAQIPGRRYGSRGLGMIALFNIMQGFARI